MGDLSTDLTGLTEREVAALSAVMGLLGEPTRLRMILLLCERERCVGELVDLLKMPQPTVSHHLGLLRRAQLLTSRREGKSIVYALDSRVELAGEGCELRLRNAPGVTILISRDGGGELAAATASNAAAPEGGRSEG